MFFQKNNSKKVKDSDGSQKKDKDSRGKNGFFDRAKGGLGALAGSLQSAKNGADEYVDFESDPLQQVEHHQQDAEERAEKLQEDVKSGIETILHKGSGILEKAKEEIGSHSEASRSMEQEQGSGGGKKGMEAFSSVLDKVKSHPEVMEKVKEEVKSLAEVLHLGKHESKEKEPEAEEKAKESETTQNVDESASANKTEGPSVVEQAVEEIQAVVAAVQQQQQQQQTARAETEIPTETAAGTSAEGEKPEEAKPEVEKDDPKKRIDFFGFFAMLFERCCSPANKKKD